MAIRLHNLFLHCYVQALEFSHGLQTKKNHFLNTSFNIPLALYYKTRMMFLVIHVSMSLDLMKISHVLSQTFSHLLARQPSTVFAL